LFLSPVSRYHSGLIGTTDKPPACYQAAAPPHKLQRVRLVTARCVPNESDSRLQSRLVLLSSNVDQSYGCHVVMFTA
jgi:hypothetical protein